ncbi:MAG: hypothetical protein M0R73_11245 [Dehalococcoidia bacterium]|nr:hypothetical protein [Dehalococcoidia bacterium]
MLRYWLLRALVEVGGRVPVRITYGLGAVGGNLAWYLSPRIRRATRDHMRHVLGRDADSAEVDRLARSCVRTNLYYYADFVRFGHIPDDARTSIFDSFDEVHGLDALFEALDQGKGVVLVGAHLGNGEVLARAAGPFGICIAIVTERLSPPRLHDYVHHVRGARGVRFLPADLTGLRASIAHLRAGGSLGLLVDRDVLGTAEPFPFFGERAPIPAGAVELARRTGAPMIGAWIPRTGPARYALHLEPIPLPEPTGDREVDLERGMRAMVTALEGAIRRWPGQWFPISAIWPQDHEPARHASPTSHEAEPHS